MQSPLRLANIGSEPEPDVVWVVPGSYGRRHPEEKDVLLLIEVAATSLPDDTVRKSIPLRKSGYPRILGGQLAGPNHRGPPRTGAGRLSEFGSLFRQRRTLSAGLPGRRARAGVALAPIPEGGGRVGPAFGVRRLATAFQKRLEQPLKVRRLLRCVGHEANSYSVFAAVF